MIIRRVITTGLKGHSIKCAQNDQFSVPGTEVVLGLWGSFLLDLRRSFLKIVHVPTLWIGRTFCADTHGFCGGIIHQSFSQRLLIDKSDGRAAVICWCMVRSSSMECFVHMYESSARPSLVLPAWHHLHIRTKFTATGIRSHEAVCTGSMSTVHSSCSPTHPSCGGLLLARWAPLAKHTSALPLAANQLAQLRLRVVSDYIRCYEQNIYFQKVWITATARALWACSCNWAPNM